MDDVENPFLALGVNVRTAVQPEESPPADPDVPGGAAEVGMSLRQLRKSFGRTQVEVATEAGMSQGDLSRLERRTDHLLSTLARYATALGGKLEVTVVRGDRRYPLDI
jgi:DNA-binding XRE family transcriptional regulator